MPASISRLTSMSVLLIAPLAWTAATRDRGTRRALPSPPLVLVEPNPNTVPSGVRRGDTLTVRLEARVSEWRADGDRHPSLRIEAFAEPRKAPLMPGPLVRAPRGTVIRFSVRNALATPLTFFVPAAIRGGPDRLDAVDSVVIAPGAVGHVSTESTVAGNYIYRATTPTGIARARRITGLLTGAMVIDTADVGAHPDDRILVLQETPDSTYAANFAPNRPPVLDTLGRLLYTINGRSWPNTERLHATVGDSLHWRVINASAAPHPMHLHGFYYRVDALTGPLVGAQGQASPESPVVTELLWPYSSMSITWSPNRPGNWLFHCHFALHLQPDSLSAAPDDPKHREMTGLVMGVLVGERSAAHQTITQQAATPGTVTRHLRLIAVEDSVPPAERSRFALPSMRFIVEEGGHRTEAPLGQSPELDLVRGEPIAITVVNRLDEPTSVHWHGIEVQDSYVDGVAGFSGAAQHLAPDIAPGDSFVARFTPPRAGTFIYHSHMDEVRQQRAGMVGALIVRSPGVARSVDEHVLLLKGSRSADGAHPLEFSGIASGDTIVLHVGRPARLRLLSLAWTNPTPLVSLTAQPDSGGKPVPVRWTLIAKDGFDVPPQEQTAQAARQVISMGETYDFAFTPTHAGVFVLVVSPDPPPGIRIPLRMFTQVVFRAQ